MLKLEVMICGDWNSGLVSLTPSRPKTTAESSSPPALDTSNGESSEVIIGMDDKSVVSKSVSDLKLKKSDCGDCVSLSHSAHSSLPDGTEKLLKSGVMGDPRDGFESKSVVKSKSSIGLYRGTEYVWGYVFF